MTTGGHGSHGQVGCCSAWGSRGTCGALFLLQSCLTQMELQRVNSFAPQEKSSASGIWSCVIFTLLLKRDRQMLPKELQSKLNFCFWWGSFHRQMQMPHHWLCRFVTLCPHRVPGQCMNLCTNRKIFPYFFSASQAEFPQPVVIPGCAGNCWAGM